MLDQMPPQEITMAFIVRRARLTDSGFLSHAIGDLQAAHASVMPELFKPTAEPYLQERLLSLLSNPAAQIFVADADGHAAGFAHFWIVNEPEGENNFPNTKVFISYVYVRAECRCNGIGRALLEEAQHLAKELSISSVELNVMAFNSAAINFFKKCGFTSLREVLFRKVESI